MDFLSNINAARILLAETDPDLMDQTADVLAEAGYSVHKAYYAGDAVYAIRHNRFDLVLVDMWMMDRDQQRLADRLVEFGSLRWIAVVDENEVNPQRLLRPHLLIPPLQNFRSMKCAGKAWTEVLPQRKMG